MSDRYIVAGLWFFGIAIVLGAAIVIAAPIPPIRVLGAIGLMSAVAGFLLHLSELRDVDPIGYAALHERFGFGLHRPEPMEAV
jgi:hypothetical protein